MNAGISEDWRERLKILFEADGYMVGGSSIKHDIGDVWKIKPLPLRVIGPSSYQEALRQFEILKQHVHYELPIGPPKVTKYWYKLVIAD